MSTRMKLIDITLDRQLFPREELDQEAVARYRDAYELGEQLPPLIVQQGTGILLDGWHRHNALTEIGADDVEIEAHVVPDDVPLLLYAAGLSSRHGVVLSNKAKREVAKRVYSVAATPVEAIAAQLAVHRTTVDRWLEPLVEEQKNREKYDLEVRRAASWLLTQAGWTQQATADWFGVEQSTVMRDLQMQSAHTRLLTDSAFLQAALSRVPEDMVDTCRAVVDAATAAEREEIAARKSKARATEDWREIEHAARACTAWLKEHGVPPEDTPTDRIQYVQDALATCASALQKELNNGK